MSVLSYAFGSAVIFTNEDSARTTRRKLGGQRNFGFQGGAGDNSNYDIIRELKKYSQGYQESTARFLANIPGSQYLNTRMLVAAYHWYFGNESPDIFTPDMFTEDNSAFSRICHISYPEVVEWKQDRYISLITYALLIKRNQTTINVKEISRDIIDRDEFEEDSDYYVESEVENESGYESDF